MGKTTLWQGLLLILAWVFLFGGCGPKTASNQAPANPLQPPANARLVQDPQQLANLWENYIYPAIPTIGIPNCLEPSQTLLFSQADPQQLLHFASVKVALEGHYTPMDDQTATLDPEILLQTVQTYFQVTLPAVDPARDFRFLPGYLPEQNAFRLEAFLGQPPTDYQSQDYAYGKKLNSVYYDKAQGLYTVNLDAADLLSDQAPQYLDTYTLKEKPDGSLYFYSFRRSSMAVAHRQFVGDYTSLNQLDVGLSGFDGGYANLTGAEINGKLLLLAYKYGSPCDENDYQITLSLLNPTSSTGEAAIEATYREVFDRTREFSGIRLLDNQIILKTNQDFRLFDLNLQPRGNLIPLPKALLQEVPKLNMGDCLGAQFYYDVSRDLQSIAYTNQKGLQLFNLKTGKSRQLQSNQEAAAKLKADLGLTAGDLYYPYFTGDDRCLISWVSGYDGPSGALLQSVGDPQRSAALAVYNHDINWHTILYPLRFPWRGESQGQYDGTLHIFTYPLDQNTLAAQPAKTDLSIFHRQVQLSDVAQQQMDSNLGTYAIYNEDYLAYTTEVLYPDNQDSASQAEGPYPCRIVRVDLGTMQADTLLEIGSGYPELKAITKDGRVLFTYNYGLEQGLILTGK